MWTWDITKLRGPAKGIFYQRYVLIDIYFRFNPSWIISPVEDCALAADFIAEAIDRNGAVPHTVHADRGTSMTSKPVSALLADLGVTRLHSRPRVSNDNRFSGAQCETLKYLPELPNVFASLAHAREFCAGFFHEYNSRPPLLRDLLTHPGLGPLRHHRRDRPGPTEHPLTAAYHAHPERFGRRPHLPVMPTQSWINQPTVER